MYQCKICGKEFTRLTACRAHERMQHQVEVLASLAKLLVVIGEVQYGTFRLVTELYKYRFPDADIEELNKSALELMRCTTNGKQAVC